MVKADIGTADIDWAHINDLATDTAIITQGTAGELYIAKLAVTEANMVSLTVGELVVKGAGRAFLFRFRGRKRQCGVHPQAGIQ